MSTVNGSPQYKTANAFRRALEDRLKEEAKARQRTLLELRKEFLFQRFLALVFAGPETRWVLKGGASLLMRLVDARSSRDLDLLHLEESDHDEAISELRELTAAQEGDHLTFEIGSSVEYSTANPVAQIKVTAYIGAVYDTFPIDLATELHLLGAPERIQPRPVVELPGLGELPEMVLYPLTDQVADKVCAMYERHGADGQHSSNRFRDLVDLALIVSASELDAGLVLAAIASERNRRDMELPTSMVSPAQSWIDGYAAYAARTKLDPELHELEAALAHVGGFLNPLLDGSRTRGQWSPVIGWGSSAAESR